MRAAESKTLNHGRVRIVVCSGNGGEVVKRLQLLRGRVQAVVDVAGPEIALREGAQPEGCHDAEVVRAAAQGKPEVAVGGLRGGQDGAVGQDDVEGEGVVAAEAGAGAEVADATCFVGMESVLFSWLSDVLE